MTEEKAKPESTQQGASQPDEKPESQKSLTDKNSGPLTGTSRSKQTKEQKTMANNEETRPENIQPPLHPNQAPEAPDPPKTPGTPEEAKQEFITIKTALIGPEPEWCLPRVNDKAKASDPKIDDSALTRSCPSVIFE